MALVVSRVTIGLLVMIALTAVVCGSNPSAVTYRGTQYPHAPRRRKPTHSIRQILSSKDTAQAFILIHDKYAVRPLGSTKLTRLRDSDVLWDSQRGAWLESRDGTLLDIGLLSAMAPTALVLLLICSGNCALTGKLALDLFPDGLHVKVISKSRQPRREPATRSRVCRSCE